MLIDHVVNYLESHKRLVIPQLGAFIVKEPGRVVVFSELLRRDDALLRSLLCEAGASEVEAAGEIDHFVFEVRHALERGEPVPLDGLGVLHRDESGAICFDFDPRTPHAHEQVPPPLAATVTLPSPVPSHTKPLHVRSEEEKEEYLLVNSAQGMHIVPEELHVSPSVKLNPEPCLKGLRYGKPKKNTNGYSFIDRHSGRRRIDRFLLIALLAALVAVAAIAFGYYRAAQERKIQALERTSMEAPAAQPENESAQ